jgi:hypothetical protein
VLYVSRLQQVSAFRPSSGIVHTPLTYLRLPYIGQYLHMRVFCVACTYYCNAFVFALIKISKRQILENRKHDVSETRSVSETSCFLFSRIPDDGKSKKPSNFVCYTPSSEPFRICLKLFNYNRRVKNCWMMWLLSRAVVQVAVLLHRCFLLKFLWVCSHIFERCVRKIWSHRNVKALMKIHIQQKREFKGLQY